MMIGAQCNRDAPSAARPDIAGVCDAVTFLTCGNLRRIRESPSLLIALQPEMSSAVKQGCGGGLQENGVRGS